MLTLLSSRKGTQSTKQNDSATKTVRQRRGVQIPVSRSRIQTISSPLIRSSLDPSVKTLSYPVSFLVLDQLGKSVGRGHPKVLPKEDEFLDESQKRIYSGVGIQIQTFMVLSVKIEQCLPSHKSSSRQLRRIVSVIKRVALHPLFK